MAHEIQRRLENGFGLTPENNLVLERSGVSGDRRFIGLARQVTRIPTASVLGLFTTPFTLLAAQGTGIATIVHRAVVYKPAGTAYGGIAAGEDLQIKYTNASGAQLISTIETTGFLDQATAQTRYAFPPASTGATAGDVTPVANAAIVAHLLVGDITTGTSDLYVELLFDIVRTAFTS